MKDYNKKDVFNADETGPFFSLCTPDKTMHVKYGTCCHGGRRSKDCVTLLLCANMSEKLKPLMFGNKKKLRYFTNIKLFF